MKKTDYNVAKQRSWLILWIIALLWLLTLMSIPTGRIPWWLFGVVTLMAFLAAWWCNLRMVSMQNRRKAGRCWKCNYSLDGIDSDHCPECGVET